MSKEKVKNWIKKHKKKFIVGSVAIAGGTLLYIANKNHTPVPKAIKDQLEKMEYKNLDISDSLTPFVEEVRSYRPEEYLDIWYKDVSYDDLGKFGEALRKSYPDTNGIEACVTTIARNVNTQG